MHSVETAEVLGAPPRAAFQPRLWLRAAVSFARAKPLGAVGAAIILAFLVVAIFAPLIATHPYTETNPAERLQGPSAAHFFGTDNLGRDVFSRVVYGARVSVYVGFGAVAIATALATLLGLISGYVGGTIDLALQRLIDVWMSIPGFILLITLIVMFKPGLMQVLVAIGLLLAGSSSRVVRSAVLTVKERPFVEATRVLGAAVPRILFRHVLVNSFAPIMVLATTQLGVAILIEATLSFLGYGVPPPAPSWGGMLGGVNREYLSQVPLLTVWPGLAIFLVVYGFNMLGDAVRDILDPRLRGAR